MSYRLLHLADLHLDRTFGALGCGPDVARRRRQGLREALRSAGDAAREHHCSAVTIGGDLYEHERAGVDTERFLQQTFASWQPMQVLIAPGNHDALMPGSLYRRVDWPANVHVFSEPLPAPVELEDGLTLWGVAHREPAWQGDPLAGEPLAAGSGVHLVLFHGAELGSRPEGKAIHGPFRADDIHRRGFTAALCGHYHRRRLDAATGLVYPGSPEPLSIDETGERGPVLVEVAGDGEITFEGLALNRWWAHSLQCDLSEAGNSSDALDALAATLLSEVTAGEAPRAMVRIECLGTLDPAVSIDAAAAAQALRERSGAALVTVLDHTETALDLELAAREESARGAFLRLAGAALRDSADPADRALTEEAVRYGLAALAGAEVALR